jgi:hypothetical protein
MDNFRRIYRIAIAHDEYRNRDYSIFVEVVYDGGRLSITGVEGPLPGGNAIGGCGQICMHMDVDTMTPTALWTKPLLARLLEIWNEWHLNDMRAECEHQHNAWDIGEKLTLTRYSWSTKFHKEREKAATGSMSTAEYQHFAEVAKRVYSVTTYAKSPKYETDTVKDLLAEDWIKPDKTETKSAGWVYEYEHPKGLLCKPCEVCGHKYGSGWLKVAVSDSVFTELQNFPYTDMRPAWI